MDDILSKLVGGLNGNGGGLDPGQLAQMLNGSGGGLSAKDAAALLGQGACNLPNEEGLAEDEKMENVGHTYDMFIQNEIPHTSHTLQWLPISHPDPEHPDFEFNYFLLGSHAGEPEDEND